MWIIVSELRDSSKPSIGMRDHRVPRHLLSMIRQLSDQPMLRQNLIVLWLHCWPRAKRDYRQIVRLGSSLVCHHESQISTSKDLNARHPLLLCTYMMCSIDQAQSSMALSKAAGIAALVEILFQISYPMTWNVQMYSYPAKSFPHFPTPKGWQVTNFSSGRPTSSRDLSTRSNLILLTGSSSLFVSRPSASD